MSIRDEVVGALLKRERREATEMIVTEILEKQDIYTIRNDKLTEMWIYNDGIYIPFGKSFIKEFVRNILGEGFTTHLCSEVISKIEADTYIEEESFFNNINIDEIVLKNGILNLKTKTLSEYTPKKIFFNKLPIKFDKTKKCPSIEKFFKDILRVEEDIKVIYELFGYCLYKEYKFEKSFMFLGNGRNGKSKTLTLLKLFVGTENTCAVPLTSLKAGEFSVSELHNKMVNLAGDLSNIDLKETGMFKSLTGRDPINAKRKFLNDVKFTNFAKLIFACNDLPRVYDTSKGFWERWVLLEFPFEFIKQPVFDSLNDDERPLKKVDDPDIIKNIVSEDELSGLLNMALEGLDRLSENKDFSYTKGSQEVKDLWVRKSNSFMAFCLDKLVEDVDNRISKKEIRREYSKYCKQHKVKSVSDYSIKYTLQELFGVVDEYIKINPLTDMQEWCWVGIKWKN